MNAMQVRQAGPGDPVWPQVLPLIRAAFAPMDGVVDPPSSVHRLTVDTLDEKAATETCLVAVEGVHLLGCCFVRQEQHALYLGKLAVHARERGRGVGRALLAAAEARARSLGLTRLRLETRIELVDNHATFAAWGFERTAENSHPGYTRPTSVEMTKRLPA
jgi:GNAT superfamily N-acetyltransferase